MPSYTSRPYTGVETHTHSSATTGGTTLSPATFTPSGDVELVTTKRVKLVNGTGSVYLGCLANDEYLRIENVSGTVKHIQTGAIGASGNITLDPNNTVDGVDISVAYALGNKYVIGDGGPVHSHDAEITGIDGAIALQKTITINVLVPQTVTLRIKFDLKDSGAFNATGRIYKNGAPFGTLRTNNTASYVTYSEDLSFSDGDTIELWAGEADTGTASVRNFRVYGTETTAVTTVDEAINNGDVDTDPFQGTNS